MRFRGLIIAIALSVSAISAYHICLTWQAHKIEQEATQYASHDGTIDFAKKQQWLNDHADKVFWNPFGVKKEAVSESPSTTAAPPKTKKEAKKRWGDHTVGDILKGALRAGIDIKGGNFLVAVPDEPSALRQVLKDPADKEVVQALSLAEKFYKANPSVGFIEHFCAALKQQKPDKPLYNYFKAADYLQPYTNSLTPTEAALKQSWKKYVEKGVEASRTTLEKRINCMVGANISLRKQGGIQIESQATGMRPLVTRQGKISFHGVVIDEKTIQNFLERLHETFGKNIKGLVRLTRHGKLYCEEKSVKKLEKLLAKPAVKFMLPKDVQVCIDSRPHGDVYLIHLLQKGYDNIRVTQAVGDFVKERGEWGVVIHTDIRGSERFEKLTQENVGGKIAVVVDNRVVFAAGVKEAISTSKFYITGEFTPEQAKEQANILTSGALPIKFKVVEETFIGPTLGQEAQSQGLWATLMALVLVVLFMLCYYAGAGCIAVAALLLNLVFILGSLAQFAAMLTLPGIAGLALTIGMAIDANVLVFERVREELRRGASVQTAVRLGYEKAYSSIIDTNVVMVLTGLILYWSGVGMIKGFALTLLIGVVSSVFTAVLVSRLLIDLFIQVLGPEKLHFGFRFTNNLLTNFHFDFLGKRFISYIFSTLVGVVGIALIAQHGLNKGVDFTGGRTYILQFKEAVPAEEIKKIASAAFEHASVDVKTYGKNTVLKLTTNYKMDSEDTAVDRQVSKQLTDAISKATGKKYVHNDQDLAQNNFTIASTAKLGATVAEDIKQGALWAIILALLMMLGYIFFRFRQASLAFAAIVALLHDILILFAAVAIAKRFGVVYEIDQVFISCILMVIGYSMNDTVIIFDRIRENMALAHTSDLGAVANRSINETLSRTSMTSFSVLIPVITLYTMGGTGLAAFAFSLLVGIVAGTYSSIYVAVPLAHDLIRLWNTVKPKASR